MPQETFLLYLSAVKDVHKILRIETVGYSCSFANNFVIRELVYNILIRDSEMASTYVFCFFPVTSETR